MKFAHSIQDTFLCVLAASCFFIIGCASTQSAKPTEAPTQQTVAPEPVPESPTPEAQSEAPQISEELASLRQSIAQNDGEKIELLAPAGSFEKAKIAYSFITNVAILSSFFIPIIFCLYNCLTYLKVLSP